VCFFWDFHNDGRFLDQSQPLPFDESPPFSGLPVLSDCDLKKVVYPAGSVLADHFPAVWIRDPAETEFFCYLSYFRRGGYLTDMMYQGLEQFINFPPLSLAFRELINKEEMVEVDVVTIRESLRIYLQHWLNKDSARKITRVMAAAGFVFDNLATLAGEPNGPVCIR
jgi:hypothetical protein